MGYRASYGPIPPITTSTIDVRAFSGVAAAAVNSLIKTANRDPIWGVKAGGSVTCAALVHEGTLYFGAHDGILYALDPLTGKERWRFPTNGPIAGGEFPVIWQDSLLFTSFDHHLYCIGLDGALRPVPGVLSMAVAVKRVGKRGFVVPTENAAEAALVELRWPVFDAVTRRGLVRGIIAQAAVPVLDDDTEETLSARILREEHRILVEAVDQVAAGRTAFRPRAV